MVHKRRVRWTVEGEPELQEGQTIVDEEQEMVERTEEGLLHFLSPETFFDPDSGQALTMVFAFIEKTTNIGEGGYPMVKVPAVSIEFIDR